MKKSLFAFALLSIGLMKTNAQSVTLSGKVLSYNSNTGYGCFYVDPEMVEAGVAKDLGSKTESSKCISKKYGKGVAIHFFELKSDSDYPYVPEQDVLISVTGSWGKKEKSYEFKTTKWEPFF